jgi:hypothetical protein
LEVFEVEVGFFCSLVRFPLFLLFLSPSLSLFSLLTLSAAIAAKKGAPVYSRQPPMTATRPAWPLRREPFFDYYFFETEKESEKKKRKERRRKEKSRARLLPAKGGTSSAAAASISASPKRW